MEFVEVGKVYVCSVPDIEGTFEVEILEQRSKEFFIARVVRCSSKQQEALKKSNYRAVVSRKELLYRSPYFG